MAFKNSDRVKETSTTTGTGTYSLDGAVTGYRTFVAGIGTGNTCHYTAENGTDWEVGIGTVTDAAPDTLARTLILASSNAGAAVSWGAGSKNVFCAMIAEQGVLGAGEPSRIIARENTLISIASSVTETDIFNKTIKGGTMGTNRLLRLLLIGARFNNSGATEAQGSLRIYIGGVKQYDDGYVALGTNASWAPVYLEVLLGMQNASNTMYMGGFVLPTGTQGSATTGIGNLSNAAMDGDPLGSASGTTFTMDATVDWALRVSWQLGTNNANVIFRRHYALLELL